MEEKVKHVLFTVLNWGLGHATRSIPVIRYLISKGIRISLAGDGESLELLKTEFPECKSYVLKGIHVYYPDKGSLALAMLIRIPGIMNSIRKEHSDFENLVDQIKPDAVISDSRFGAWTKKIPSVFITHQLWIKMPSGFQWMEPILFELNKRRIKNFTSVWVPDFPGEQNLSGDLSHQLKAVQSLHPVYFGPMSRFTEIHSSDTHDRYEILIIVSGPEPQRTSFEKLCIDQAKETGLSTLLVRGKPLENIEYSIGNVKVISHLPSGALKSQIEKAKYIVCRPGYSTLMDLALLNKSAICIPTPGQTEQEYLGTMLSEKGSIICCRQTEFNLKAALKDHPPGKLFIESGSTLMKQTIDQFLR